jgi:hypothetical protein
MGLKSLGLVRLRMDFAGLEGSGRLTTRRPLCTGRVLCVTADV